MWNMTLILSIIWAFTLLYGEWFAYRVPSLWTCSWPHLPRSNPLNAVDSDYVKIAVITDPQLMDSTSHHLARKSLLLEIAQFYTDIYMRRAFHSSVLPFGPDAILFLGDYFDGGDILSDEEWKESHSRLGHIFNLDMLETSNIKVYYLSGNHDIGYTAQNSRKPEVMRRYERVFGARNFKVTLGNVDFIAVDAQTLDGLPQGNLTSTAWNFINDVSKGNDSNPRVLLTHIPLYRPDWTPCGPLRSSPVINQRISRVGRSQEILYQNYVTKRSSTVLLDLIKPALVLSGHDHDQCSVNHTLKLGPVTEHTVGTVSWQMGNLYPSFMLLSASNSTIPNGSPGNMVLTQLCFLPMQTHIYIWYLSLFAITLVIVLLWPANEVHVSQKIGSLAGGLKNLFNSIRTKEKNDDENCEYEEIWDAEGSLHLIKKASKPVPKVNDRTSVERGNAVMRSNVRKQMEQDSADVSIQLGSDSQAKLPARTHKSRAKMIIWRILQAVRALSIIAAINLPLYVLLIFKDWIDK